MSNARSDCPVCADAMRLAWVAEKFGDAIVTTVEMRFGTPTLEEFRALIDREITR